MSIIYHPEYMSNVDKIIRKSDHYKDMLVDEFNDKYNTILDKLIDFKMLNLLEVDLISAFSLTYELIYMNVVREQLDLSNMIKYDYQYYFNVVELAQALHHPFDWDKILEILFYIDFNTTSDVHHKLFQNIEYSDFEVYFQQFQVDSIQFNESNKTDIDIHIIIKAYCLLSKDFTFTTTITPLMVETFKDYIHHPLLMESPLKDLPDNVHFLDELTHTDSLPVQLNDVIQKIELPVEIHEIVQQNELTDQSVPSNSEDEICIRFIECCHSLND